jgi:histidine triad (HIT) family protein
MPEGQQASPEEMAALQEKIKNMSPEELKEFQKKQCIFCQIIEGKVQAKKIYEDDKCIAVLDINPGNPGHMLLMPKEHYAIMPQIPKDELAHLFITSKFLSNVVLKAIEAGGTNIIVANGPAAGQRAQHFMIHIIPRKDNDGIEFTLPQKKHSESDLDTVKGKIEERLAAVLKVKKPAAKAPMPVQVPKAPKPEVKPPAKAAPVKEEKVVEAVVKEPKKVVKKKKKAKKKAKVKEVIVKPEVEVVVEPEVKVEAETPKKKPEKKAAPKKAPEPKEKPEKKEKPKKKEKEEDVSLDDIANVLGL